MINRTTKNPDTNSILSIESIPHSHNISTIQMDTLFGLFVCAMCTLCVHTTWIRLNCYAVIIIFINFASNISIHLLCCIIRHFIISILLDSSKEKTVCIQRHALYSDVECHKLWNGTGFKSLLSVARFAPFCLPRSIRSLSPRHIDRFRFIQISTKQIKRYK